ncbi:sn-glycerol-3-phosphate ABC transporter ATP-binding protein UgpC [Duganella sp. FT92W]|uniref:sn-glycerol-3-phosphate ABC transporter ATP-binding protein UgpC n=1 Tax=Pseudoduganella rivuli TaxID=2666085 RepID=A0A7X2INL9_9BURK|nr:sn-glycerol-3-phosphate ABC transporter ATP-binding protein UgpC [Pseudoduganella rivuli]MRV73164.1 sn-glycerol-3-phosphate ABC transporter ATP-binding protein UgpC [Pseudoduganella rivuli]
MAAIELAGVAKAYAGRESAYILKDISFAIGDGEFVVLVGPSGCGKSTLLRMIAGLEEITGGEIRIGGARVNETPPARRGLSMVFQNYALYAHMSVYENIAFGLKLARVPKQEIDPAVRDVARMLQLEHLLQRRPPQLSGGQRQRVAIGRAIVRKPRAFLFDEPLSNLDAALRADMRVEIARLHRQLGATMVYVTHDQVEAMTLADRIVVLSPNGVQQIGAPMALYDAPANTFVAGFIGSPKMNLAGGAIDVLGRLQFGGLAVPGWSNVAARGQDVTVGIRPEHLLADPGGPLRGRVALVERLGAESHVHLALPGVERPLVAAIHGEPPAVDSEWACRPAPGRVHVFDQAGRRIETDRAVLDEQDGRDGDAPARVINQQEVAS